ncbi:MAG: MotA/TolQ/ExbB proton channel family protein [Bacteriovoracaceae bacterium]|nr:MotA/TolQ/ExbB proton channel family protein [Bacteriovoracaceae bacterium]
MEETAVATTTSPESVGGILGLINQLVIFVQEGGIFMYVILVVWGIGIAICFERYRKLKQLDVDGPSFMNELQRYILSNDIQGAIRVCSGSVAALAKVLKSGLKRASQNPEQVQNAIDATALEVIPKIELRLNYLSLVANVSTLFGLLGTIQGLIQSFAAVGAADPEQKAEILSIGIAVAMNTTALGLFSAITIMVSHSLLGAKAEKIIGEIDEFSVKLIDMLGTKKENK